MDQELISEQLREAIRKSGRSACSISVSIGIHKAALSRFLAGTGGLSQDVVNKLGLVFGLRQIADEEKVAQPIHKARPATSSGFVNRNREKGSYVGFPTFTQQTISILICLSA